MDKKPFESVIAYLSKVEEDILGDKNKDKSIESKLTTVYALYMAAWAIGEVSWDEAFYGFADFTAKLLKIR